jgi:hypothetical protein
MEGSKRDEVHNARDLEKATLFFCLTVSEATLKISTLWHRCCRDASR